MADPLGLIGGNGGGGIHRLGGLGAHGQKPTGPDCGPGSFKDALIQSLDDVNRLQQEADTAAEDLATGKRNDVENVLLATQKADTAFRLLVQLRNKMQTAYDEIKQVRI